MSQGEDILHAPAIVTPVLEFRSALPFRLQTMQPGDSQVQHLDEAFAHGLLYHFVEDGSLVLTHRGRLYARGVRTELDACYEGENQILLAKNVGGPSVPQVTAMELYYPLRQWSSYTNKHVSMLFFQRMPDAVFHLWHFGCDNPNDYNSIRLLKSGRYRIVRNP